MEKRRTASSAGIPVKVATLLQHTQSRGCVGGTQEASWSLVQRCTFFGSYLPIRKTERWRDSALYYHPPPSSKRCVCQPPCSFFQATHLSTEQLGQKGVVLCALCSVFSALALKSLLTNSTPPYVSSPPRPAGWQTTGPSAVTAR